MLCVLLATVACMAGEAWEPRLQPDPAALEELMRDERWALVQAQEAYGRKQWKAAAALYQKYTVSFPDSAMFEVDGIKARSIRLWRKTPVPRCSTWRPKVSSRCANSSALSWRAKAPLWRRTS